MEVGTHIRDWECIQILGRGNFGVVGLWINRNNGQSRAVKKFEAGAYDEKVMEEVEKRWKKEVDLMYHQIESPYIVSTLPIPDELRTLSRGNTGRLPLLSMEYCSGGDLRQVLRKPDNAAGLPEKQVRKVLKCLGEAISYLHSINIIHRDLKPENILLSAPTEDGVYKLSDLGFAKDLAHSDSFCSTVVGTVQYLAPEVFIGKPYDKSVDYWSFGIIAFEVTCGMRPFLHGRSPAQWLPYVETKENDVIAICEGEKGKVIQSSRIPYNTHLSERLKQCLEMWLKMMLQMDPRRRGKKTGGIGEGEVVGLQVLRTILEMEMLEVFCPARKLAFAIGRSTTIAEVSQWITRDIGVPILDQLLVTIDGRHLQATVLPLELHRESLALFMIPKNISNCSGLKIPKCLRGFLQTWESVGDRFCMRKVWAAIVHFLQTELNQMEMLQKAICALRHCHRRIRNEIEEVVKVHENTIKSGFLSLENIVAFERELNSVDNRFALPEEYTSSCSQQWEEKFDHIRTNFELHMTKFWGISDLDTKTETTLQRSELQTVYEEVLQCLEEWRAGNNEIQRAVHCLCQFIALREVFWNAAREHRSEEMELLDMTQGILTKLEETQVELEQWKTSLIDSRCQKQRLILGKAFIPKEPENSEDRLKNIMEESIMLDIEMEDRLKRAMRESSETLMARSKLDWNFLDSD